MKTAICRNEDGTYDLLVNGELSVESESLGMVASVAYFLDEPKAWDTSEACEIAQAIRNSEAIRREVAVGAHEATGAGRRLSCTEMLHTTVRYLEVFGSAPLLHH